MVFHSQDVRVRQTDEEGNSPSRVQKPSKLVGFFYQYKYRYYPYLATFSAHFNVINEKEAS